MRWCARILRVSQASQLSFRPQQRHAHAAILGLVTGNPKHTLSNKDALNMALNALKSDEKRPLLETIYSKIGIENRYTPIHTDFFKYLANKGKETNQKRPEHLTDDDCFYPEDGTFKRPIDQRLKKFKEVATPLVNDVALKAIKESGINTADIGKVVFVSSTGFLSPGIDCDVIKSLELSTNVSRTCVGFMGCGGSINGLRVASDFVLSNPDKKALMVCVELNSLHFSNDDDIHTIMYDALFGDGCVAAVLGAADEKTSLKKGSIKLVDRMSLVAQETNQAVMMTLGPKGIRGVLSKDLPKHILNNIKPFVDTLLTRNNVTQTDVKFWSLHPGGVPIVRNIQQGLDLTSENLSYTWDVLRENGNMGGPSVLFVLEKILKKHKSVVVDGEETCKRGMLIAINPGLCIEGIYVEMI